VINNLLKLMYPKDIETREKVAYMAMKVALGVTCGLTSGIKRGKVSSNDFARLGLEGMTSNASSSCLSSCDTNQKQPEVTEKNAKIPLRHLSTILKDIFIFLFSEQPVVVLIEEAQDLDESSWKLIISLKKTQRKVFIVLMQEPIAYLNTLYCTAGSNSSIGALINPDSSIFYDWIEPYVNKLSNYKKYSYMLLPEFTFLEVRTLLANVLKVGVKDLPTGLDLMVYNLSGGNPYW
jgi:predicted ATPase